ncbi:MAG: acetate--CoA ligase family protein [Pseudomonadota bacterium]
MAMGVEDLLNPHSIAVYGASPRQTSPAAHIFRNLIGQGFAGPVTAINPKYAHIGSHPCFPSQVVAGQKCDLAVIAIPPAAVPQALQDCAAVGTRAAIIITAGFEDGTGPASTSRLLKVAREAGIVLMGPNCLGLLRPHLRLNATFQSTLPPVGGLALISQSGAICSAMADMAETKGLAFSLMMSLGNSLDIGLPEAIRAASGDARTKVILVYVEGVRRGEAFRAALSEACGSKPVIVLKAGRHAAGSEAASTHTGALIGSDRVFSAVLRDAGAVQVQTLSALIETARLLDRVDVSGPRLAVVTNGGGAGVLTADRLADRHVPDAPLPQAVVEGLDAVLSPNWSRRNPLDLVGDATAEHFKAAILACLESRDFDAVLALLSPQSMTAPSAVAEGLVEARNATPKPVLTCFLGGSTVASARAYLKGQGIVDFDLPEDAVIAFSNALSAKQAQGRTRRAPRIAAPVHAGSAGAIRDVGPFAPGLLSDSASRQLLARAGIPCPIPQTAGTEEAAVAMAAELPGAAVLKVASPDVSHKSEVNGVLLNVMGPADIKAGFRRIKAELARTQPDARFSGVTIEPFVAFSDARELLIGVTKDPVFGQVLTFGTGGTLVEFIDDVSTALLPLTHERALEMISATKVAKLLGPFRSMEPVSLEAIAGILRSVSDLCATLPEIEELDINPLLASPEGLCAVDARIRIGGSDTPLLSPE